MKPVFFSIVLLTVGFSAFAGTTSYRCQGGTVSGVVEVHEQSGSNGRDFPAYSAVSNLLISGRKATLNCSGNVSYFKKEIFLGNGAWKYDYSRKVYALCGADLNLNGSGEGLHLEVSTSGRVRGYLGHKDHERSASDNTRFDFSCRKI